MISAKCWNDDIGSLDLYQAQQTWVDGKSAMTVTAGTDVRKFVKPRSAASKVGVMTMPKYANGVGAGKLGSTSQTLGDQLVVAVQAAGGGLHPVHAHAGRAGAVLQGHGRTAGRRPLRLFADRRAAGQAAVRLLANGAPYLENFIPTDLDSKANFGGVQLMFAGKATAAQAAATMESTWPGSGRSSPT